MKIIILGAGQVGGTLTEHLADEQNDVTVVDSSDSALRQLQERLDIRTVKGDASKPTTLADAGAEDADMLIAVTDSDEVNMLACTIAYTLYRTPTKICRIREVDYLNEDKKLFQSVLSLSMYDQSRAPCHRRYSPAHPQPWPRFRYLILPGREDPACCRKSG